VSIVIKKYGTDQEEKNITIQRNWEKLVTVKVSWIYGFECKAEEENKEDTTCLEALQGAWILPLAMDFTEGLHTVVI
jgi:hypothetical protein